MLKAGSGKEKGGERIKRDGLAGMAYKKNKKISIRQAGYSGYNSLV